MAEVHFTARLRGVVPASPVIVDGATVGEALEHIFARNARARSYVLDEQGRLRKHVCIFLNGERLVHEAALDAALDGDAEIHVMQALSGG
jgi:molybdopterin converting factor small subunit